MNLNFIKYNLYKGASFDALLSCSFLKQILLNVLHVWTDCNTIRMTKKKEKRNFEFGLNLLFSF